MRALADRLAEAGIPHVLRGPPFTPEGDPTTSLLVPAERREEAMETTGTGRRSVRRLHRCSPASATRPATATASWPCTRSWPRPTPAIPPSTTTAAPCSWSWGGPRRRRPPSCAAPAAGSSAWRPVSPRAAAVVGGAGGLGGAVARTMGRLAGSGGRPHVPDYLVDAEMQLLALEERMPQRKELLHGLASIARVKGDAETAAPPLPPAPGARSRGRGRPLSARVLAGQRRLTILLPPTPTRRSPVSEGSPSVTSIRQSVCFGPLARGFDDPGEGIAAAAEIGFASVEMLPEEHWPLVRDQRPRHRHRRPATPRCPTASTTAATTAASSRS